jgi:hypothetical protein
MGLLSTCSNYQSLFSINFFIIGATATLSLMVSFLTTQHSVPYNIAGLTDVRYNFPFNLSGTFLSHKTPETLLHFDHPAWIRWCTSASISPSFCTMDSKYLNRVTWGSGGSRTLDQGVQTFSSYKILICYSHKKVYTFLSSFVYINDLFMPILPIKLILFLVQIISVIHIYHLKFEWVILSIIDTYWS